MEQAIYTIAKNQPEVWDETKKQEIFTYIQNHQHTGKAARTEHKEQVKTYTAQLSQQRQAKVCPYCHVNLVLRNGKFGEFYGCPNYPKCKYTAK